MKVSIIGTNGFLSNAIAEYANSKGWSLYAYGYAKPQSELHFEYYKEIDLLESDLDYSLLADSDIVVYAAGAGIQSNINEDYRSIYALNVTVPISICNELKKINYEGTFVTFGSYFELGERIDNEKATEKDVIDAISQSSSDYVLSKRLLTRFVVGYHHNYTHWHFILPTIYGVGENPQRLIPYTINAIRNKQTLNFTAGSQIRQYLHVSEVPFVIDVAINKEMSSGVYSIAGAETMSVREIVSLIHSYFDLPVPNNCFGNAMRTDEKMKYLALDGTKLYKEIGFVAKEKMYDRLKDYCI